MTLPAIQFPEGTERTWLLTYTDDDTRLVRAGVDGGRSTARELGLIREGEGEAADAYLFYLTRVSAAEAAPPSLSNPLAAAARRRALKARLRSACDGQRLGAESSPSDVIAISDLVEELAPLNPTADAASSALLCGRWDIVRTAQSELLLSHS